MQANTRQGADMATEQELAQALAPAFGMYPKAFRGNYGNPQDAANLPVDVLRGRTAGLLGLPGDLLNMLQSPKPMEAFGDTQYEPKIKVPYDTERFLQTLPLAPTSRAGQVAGQAASFVPLNPAPAVRAGIAGAKALAPTAANMAEQYMVKTGGILPLDVYHGTPHTLPPTERNPLGEFDASKIGTGEGAQAYGHGIYTAENPAVAKSYQFMEQNWFDTSKAKYKGKSIDSWYEQAQKDQERAFRTKDKTLEKDATARLAYWENVMTHNHPESVVQQFADPAYGWPEATNYAKSIDLGKFSGIPRSGNLYKADLPDDMIAKMLDWDKPLSADAPKEVKDAFNSIIAKYPELKNKFYQAFKDKQPGSHYYSLLNDYAKTGDLVKNQTFASDAFKAQGIPGIKYLDEASRAKGEGTRNFVIFPGEEKNLTILERNAEKSVK